MRTYDPADAIRYVHLAQEPAATAAAAATPPHDDCRRLPAGYANGLLAAGLRQRRTPGGRAALVLLPGGAAVESPAPALRLAR